MVIIIIIKYKSNVISNDDDIDEHLNWHSKGTLTRIE